MKIKNLLLVVVAIFAAVSVSAAPVGSIIKKGVPLDQVVTTNGGAFPAGATVDFKAVTVDGKLWAKAVGTGYNLAGNPWSSQVRIYSPALFEISPNTSAAYMTVNAATLTTVVTAYPYASLNRNFTRITVLQEDNNEFNSAAIWDFDKTAANSGLTETESPVLTDATPGTQVGASLPVTLAATDDSGDFFYYISDDENNYHTILFESGTLSGLAADTEYNFTVVAIDYAGNISNSETFTVGAAAYESVVDGIADDIEFRIYSTANAFTIYAKPVSATTPVHHFLVQVGVPGTEFTTGEGATPTPNEVVYERFPGETSWFSGEITGVTGNAEGIVRLNIGYRIGPLDYTELNSLETYENFYGRIKYTGKLTEGDRAGELIDFKLGDSSKEDRPAGIQAPVVDKAEKARQYFTIDGRAVTEPTFGIYIVKKIYVDGSVATEKVLVQ